MNFSLTFIKRWLLISGILCTQLAKAQVTQQEFEALKNLYFDLGNPSELFNWNFTSASANDVNSSWSGLTVENGYVTSIDLHNTDPGNSTYGSRLSPAISNFPVLKKLSLAQYNLGGSIPTVIGNLTNLEELRLQFTWLDGSIPASMGNLTKLKTLDLSINRFAGTIPAFIGNLTQLEHLDLSSNQFTGTIPAFIGNLTQLEHLNLSGNQLKGTIPAFIGNLTQLKHLSLFNNQFTGTIPAAIGNLTKLENLYLSDNQLRGTIPAAIGNLTRLENLYLSDNQLTGNIPTTISNLTQLERLHLFKNRLHGSIPNEIGNLTKLFWLKISDNQLTGAIPASIGNLTALGRLNLSHNNINGSIPDELGALINLDYLNLSNNKLQGALPIALSHLTSTRSIELQNNQLSSLPDLSGNSLFNPTTFKVDNNQLSFGHILSNIAKLTSYAPQAKYTPLVTAITLEAGEVLSIDGLVAGSGNTYAWYKGERLVFSEQKFTKNKVAVEDAGTYVCRVTNPLVPGLTLESIPINVTVTNAVAPIVSNLIPVNGSSLPEGEITFKISFSEKIKKGSGEVLIKRASDHSIVQRYDIATITLREKSISFSIEKLATASYYITISSGVVTDLAGHPFVGINNSTTWTFSVQGNEKPQIMTFAPANNSRQINATLLRSLKITFSKAITKGAGHIQIKKSKDNALVKSIDVQSNQVAIQGKEVTINLGDLLTDETSYYVNIASTAFKDAENNYFDGIEDTSTWWFSLGIPAPPTLVQTSPTHKSLSVAVNLSSLKITFSETVVIGTQGEITIRTVANDEIVEQIGVQSGKIKVNNQNVTILLGKPLKPHTLYYVSISSGTFSDIAGWGFAGINDNTTWQFTTKDIRFPIVTSLSPAHQSTIETKVNTLSITFEEAIQKGSGTIYIKAKSNNEIMASIEVNTTEVTVQGNKVTILFEASKLQESHTYYVTIPAAAFKSTSGNAFVGIAEGDWEFTQATVLKKQVQVYPNPCADKVFVTLPARAGKNVTYKIINTEGNLIKQGAIGPQGNINFKDISVGVYFLRIDTGEDVVIKRVIKK